MLFSASGYKRCPLHHHPVFGPVVMLLQREFRSWFYRDPLDLKTVVKIQAFIRAPGAIDRSMDQCFISFGCGLKISWAIQLVSARHWLYV
jgi:hypothetical protein